MAKYHSMSDLEPVGSALFTISEKKPTEAEYVSVTGTEVVLESAGAATVKRESDNVMMVNYLDLKTAKSDKKDHLFYECAHWSFQRKWCGDGQPLAA